MQIITDHKLIRKNKKITKVLLVASLLVLGAGLLVAIDPNINLFPIAMICMALGFLLSQIYIYFNNRWAKSPTYDEILTIGLKGLESRYTLYHYSSPVPHLLLGPAGIWVIAPYSQVGAITFDEVKNRWKQKGGNWYLKTFAQESIGRPDLEVQSYIDDMRKFAAKHLPEAELPEPQVVLVFTHPKAVLQAQSSPIPAVTLDKLKEFIRKRAKENQVTLDQLSPLIECLPDSSTE